MPARINRANYRESVARLERESERAKASGHDSTELHYVDSIGNMHREFGSVEEARACYSRAISLARTQVPDRPLDSVAVMLWKAGDLASMAAECRALLEVRGKEREALESSAQNSDESRRMLMLVYVDLAKAAFLLGDYVASEGWAERAKTLQAYGPTTVDVLIRLSHALNANDRVDFETALRLLRGMLLSWPSFESDPNRELYRVALSLGRERFGSIPADLNAELLGSGLEGN